MKQAFAGLALTALMFSALPASAQRSRLLTPQPSESRADASRAAMTVDAYTEGAGVYVRWQLGTDLNATGFNVYRQSGKGLEQVNPYLIAGPAMHNGVADSAGTVFSYFDASGSLGDSYLIETKYVDGATERGSAASAQYLTDLRTVAGKRFDPKAGERVAADTLGLETSTPVMPSDLAAVTTKTKSLANLRGQMNVAALGGTKIGIKADGFYRVTRAQLQSAGFNVNLTPTNWQLYTDGIEQSITVEPSGGYIEFYGKAINTLETNVRMYYLVAGNAAGKRIKTYSQRPIPSDQQVTNFKNSYSKAERNSYVNTILNGDVENWWGRAVSNTATSFPFTVKGIDTDSPTATVTISLYGFTTLAHSVSLTLNGNVLSGQATGNGQVPVVYTGTIPTSFLVDGNNTLSMTTSGPADQCMFDNIKVVYDRKFSADQNTLSFYTANYRPVTVGGFSSANVRVFDVTAGTTPQEYRGLATQLDGSTYDVKIPAGKTRLFYAVENSAFRIPYSIEANTPSNLRSTAHNADLVIVYYKDYAAQAEAWATYRRGQGTLVETVDVDDVYDEFSYGLKNWQALNGFLKYAKTSWQTPPRYALLLGGATENPKDYDPVDGPGFHYDMPTKLVDTLYTQAPSDEAVGDFNNDGLSDIAIGRIAGHEVADVNAALVKTIQFENGLNTLSRGAMFAYDLPDGYDFQAMSGRLSSQLPAGTSTTMIGRGDVNANTNVLAAINSGKYLANYAGHGTIGIWATSTFFGNPYVSGLQNTGQPTVFTMLTCLNGYFLNMYGYSLAENLLETPNIGAVAVWASTGKTTPDVQEIMATRFLQKTGSGEIVRLGDLVLDAKSTLPDAHDVRLSWVLLGDPMLKMH